MNKKKIIENYAIALFKLAIKNKKYNEYLNNVNMIIYLFKNNFLYFKILSNIYILKKERKNILKKAFYKQINNVVFNLLCLLIDNNYFYYVILIFKKFRKLINEINDIQYGNIYSVQLLTQKQINIIQNKLIKLYKYRIKLINKIDKTLIGGIKIKIRNIVIDGSIINQLRIMKDNILK